MLLTKLTLHNFGIYAGRHVVDLTPKAGRPIILFGALNGAGKTTLLEGIQFALFGKLAKFLGKGKSAYIEFLANTINRDCQDGSASVSLEFRTQRHGQQQQLEVVRTWRLSNNPSDTVQVFRDGELDTGLSERWVEIAETFFPSQLSDLFFFDGERIESLAQPARCSELIKTGLNSLLGLDLVADLSKTLVSLERRLKIEGLSSSDKERLGTIDAKVKSLSEQKLASEAELQQAVERDAHVKVQLEDLRAQLKQQGGDLYAQRDHLVQRQNDLVKSIAAKRTELVELAASAMPLTLVDALLEEAEKYAMRGLSPSQKDVVGRALSSFSSSVLTELSKRKSFEQTQLQQIQLIHATLLGISEQQENLPEINISREVIFRARTEGALKRAAALKVVLELGAMQNEFDQIESNLLAVPDGSKLEALFAQIKTVEDASTKSKLLINYLEEQLRRQERELETTQRQFDALGAQLQSQQAEERQLVQMKARLSDGRNVLQLFEDKIRSKHLHRLQVLVKDGFSALLRKQAFIRSIEICPETFSLNLNIIGRGSVPASKLSAGERQLLAVAVLWALGQASGRKLPTVIDTPLGRLDSKHRSKYVQNYFPHAGHQVILLSTDEEIVGRYHEHLKPHLAREYLIKYNEEQQSSAIENGYFQPSLEPA